MTKAKAATALAETFGCSELAADEICTQTLALAQAFVAVHNAYSLDHVLAAKRSTSKTFHAPHNKTFSGSGQARQEAERVFHVQRNRRSLSRGSIKLLDCVQVALEAKERFRTALNIAHCQNHMGQDVMLSEVLAALHDNRQLSQPEKVSDGRLAYESIRRDSWLLKMVGILQDS